MKILLNARSKKHGEDLLSDVSKIVPQVRAFMFPLADSNCVMLEFKEQENYTKEQTEMIIALQALGRMSA